MCTRTRTCARVTYAYRINIINIKRLAPAPIRPNRPWGPYIYFFMNIEKICPWTSTSLGVRWGKIFFKKPCPWGNFGPARPLTK